MWFGMVEQRGRGKWLWMAAFLGPSLLGLMVFVVLPILSSLWYAFHDWNLLSPPRFIGFDNFTALMQDAAFWSAVRYTLTFIVMYVPVVFVLGLGLALLLNQKARGILIVRTASFLPVVASWVVVSLIWKWIFNPSYGLVNYALGLVGISGPAWLFEPSSSSAKFNRAVV
jgi:multiple sugar transport system permease protein